MPHRWIEVRLSKATTTPPRHRPTKSVCCGACTELRRGPKLPLTTTDCRHPGGPGGYSIHSSTTGCFRGLEVIPRSITSSPSHSLSFPPPDFSTTGEANETEHRHFEARSTQSLPLLAPPTSLPATPSMWPDALFPPHINPSPRTLSSHCRS